MLLGKLGFFPYSILRLLYLHRNLLISHASKVNDGISTQRSEQRTANAYPSFILLSFQADFPAKKKKKRFEMMDCCQKLQPSIIKLQLSMHSIHTLVSQLKIILYGNEYTNSLQIVSRIDSVHSSSSFQVYMQMSLLPVKQGVYKQASNSNIY